MCTVRIRREKVLMRLLTVMVSGGTSGGFPALAKVFISWPIVVVFPRRSAVLGWPPAQPATVACHGLVA